MLDENRFDARATKRARESLLLVFPISVVEGNEEEKKEWRGKSSAPRSRGTTKVWDAEKWSRKGKGRKKERGERDIQRIFPREIEI